MLIAVISQSTAILAIALALTFCSSSPSLRSSVLFGALLLLPLTLFSAYFGWSLWYVTPPLTLPSTEQIPASQLLAPIVRAHESTSIPLSFLVWAAIAFLLGSRCVVQLVRAYQLRTMGLLCSCDNTQAMFGAAKHSLRMNQDVRLLESKEIDGPGVIGFLRPAVLLPATHQFNQTQLEHVLMHELAHVRRGDWLVIQLCRLAAVLFWWHPLVWLCLIRGTKEMELACDYEAIQHSSQAADYAMTLTSLRSGQSLFAQLTFLPTQQQLKQRVVRVLEYRPQRTWPKQAANLCLAAAIFGVITVSTKPNSVEPTMPLMVESPPIGQSAALTTVESNESESEMGQSAQQRPDFGPEMARVTGGQSATIIDAEANRPQAPTTQPDEIALKNNSRPVPESATKNAPAEISSAAEALDLVTSTSQPTARPFEELNRQLFIEKILAADAGQPAKLGESKVAAYARKDPFANEFSAALANTVSQEGQERQPGRVENPASNGLQLMRTIKF